MVGLGLAARVKWRNPLCAGLLTLAIGLPAWAEAPASESRDSQVPSQGSSQSSARDVLGRAAPDGCTLPSGAEYEANSLIGAATTHCRAAETEGLARQFVGERLAVWRQRLDLEDWQVSVVLTRRASLKPKTLGGIRWDKAKKSAVVWVLDPADYGLSCQETMADMERTIVHELLHLALASKRRSEASRGSEEQAVNRIAEAFLKLDRQR